MPRTTLPALLLALLLPLPGGAAAPVQAAPAEAELVRAREDWARLAQGHWVADGRADAPRIVYAFADPNCGYCNRFWLAARPFVASGQVQLRHLMVGIIGDDSPGKAAAILGAEVPAEALARNERNYRSGGIRPLAKVPPALQARLDANEKLLRALGFHGTPGLVYLDAEGRLKRFPGLPDTGDLAQILGAP